MPFVPALDLSLSFVTVHRAPCAMLHCSVSNFGNDRYDSMAGALDFILVSSYFEHVPPVSVPVLGPCYAVPLCDQIQRTSLTREASS